VNSIVGCTEGAAVVDASAGVLAVTFVGCGRADGVSVGGSMGLTVAAGEQDATRNSETNTSKASLFKATP